MLKKFSLLFILASIASCNGMEFFVKKEIVEQRLVAQNGKKRVVYYLKLSSNTDLNILDEQGFTLLHHAVADGRDNLVLSLLNQPTIKQSLQTRDTLLKRTPLAMAFVNKYTCLQLEALLKLIEASKDVINVPLLESKGSEYKEIRVLYQAYYYEIRQKIFEALINAGATTSSIPNNNQAAFAAIMAINDSRQIARMAASNY